MMVVVVRALELTGCLTGLAVLACLSRIIGVLLGQFQQSLQSPAVQVGAGRPGQAIAAIACGGG
jgi:hypothetical protein